MSTLVDSRVREDVERFTCEHCVRFETERRACANEYPTQARLDVDLDKQPSLEFCKEFELV